MKPFVLDSSMLTLRGVFYPTGHVIMMIPGQEHAKKACACLAQHGIEGENISLLSPETIMGDLARTIGNSDVVMPSAGTEADTVRRLTELAAQGHWGVLVYAPHGKDSADMMEWLKDVPVAYAQKYRQLVIEDLVT